VEQRKTQRELLDELVGTGRLSADDARGISGAPLWTFSVRELVGYLAGLIIATGALLVVGVVFADASKWAVVTALYAITVVAGLVGVQLHSRGSWQERLAEVLEAAAIGSAIGATGIVLDHVEMRGAWIGLVLSGAAGAWGLARTARSRFIGTVVMSVALPAFAIVVAALIDENSDWLRGVTMLVAAGVLLAAGNLPIGSSFVARAIGSVYVIAGSAALGSGLDSPAHLIPIVTGALLFSAATTILAPEMLIAGAVCVVTGVVMTVSAWIEGDLARGLVIVATGLVMLVAIRWQMRRGLSRPGPDAPAV